MPVESEVEVVNQGVVVAYVTGGVSVPVTNEALKLPQERVTGVVAFGDQTCAALCSVRLVPGVVQFLSWLKLVSAEELGDGAGHLTRLVLLGKDVWSSLSNEARRLGN